MNPRNELEEWLTELPPLDGADDEQAVEDSADELIPDDPDNASLDDAVADDLEVDEGVDITEEEPSHADDERWEADVGEPDIDVAGESGATEAEAPVDSPDEGELDIDDGLPESEEDAGEEGTTDPIEHSLDEELPALDADDEGDFEDELLREVQLAAASSSTVRWGDVLWEQVGPSRSLAWPLAEDDAIYAMSAAVSSNTYVVGAVGDGTAWLASFSEPKAKIAQRVLRPPLDDRGRWKLAISGIGHPVIWVSNLAGELTTSRDLGESWVRCASLARPTLALGMREDGSVSLLARKGDGVELLTSADGTRWFAERLTIELQTGDARQDALAGHEKGSVWLAHRGSAVAVGDAGGVSVARDGRHFVRIPGTAGATAGTFAGDTAEAPLLLAGALVEGDEALHLARVPRDGAVEIIGEIGPNGASYDGVELPRVHFLLWHEASESASVGLASHVSTWRPGRAKS